MALITFIRGGSVHLDMSTLEAEHLFRNLPNSSPDPYESRFIENLNLAFAARIKAVRMIDSMETSSRITLEVKS